MPASFRLHVVENQAAAHVALQNRSQVNTAHDSKVDCTHRSWKSFHVQSLICKRRLEFEAVPIPVVQPSQPAEMPQHALKPHQNPKLTPGCHRGRRSVCQRKHYVPCDLLELQNSGGRSRSTSVVHVRPADLRLQQEHKYAYEASVYHGILADAGLASGLHQRRFKQAVKRNCPRSSNAGTRGRVVQARPPCP
jgi:hypothetical protein